MGLRELDGAAAVVALQAGRFGAESPRVVRCVADAVAAGEWQDLVHGFADGAVGVHAAVMPLGTLEHAIAGSEEVTVGVSERQWENARAALSEGTRLVELTTNQSWVRDHGPTFVIDATGRRRGVDWRFNNYGSHH